MTHTEALEILQAYLEEYGLDADVSDPTQYAEDCIDYLDESDDSEVAQAIRALA